MIRTKVLLNIEVKEYEVEQMIYLEGGSASHRHPNASSHRLAQLTFQTDQSFGALANRLVARGLINRVTGPGRALRRCLTPAGEALLSEDYPVYNEVLSKSFSPLSSTERDTLYDLLTRLLHGSDAPLVE